MVDVDLAAAAFLTDCNSLESGGRAGRQPGTGESSFLSSEPCKV